MPQTRRSVLKEIAFLSITSTALPFLEGCVPKHFADGIRVFFEGAWLFCIEPGNSRYIRAVTFNPPELPPPPACAPRTHLPSTDMAHIFPYGVWDENGSWDHNHPCLPANAPSTAASPLVP